MKHTVKEFFNTKTKVCFWIIAGIISCLVYCFTGQEIDEAKIVDKACEVSGKC